MAGILADKMGRKRALMIAGVLFVGGALVQSLAPGTGILVLGRFVIGLGVGVASVAAPLYAAEMAPAESRGRFVSTYQLAITMGIFIAYIVDAWQADTGDWRLMLGIAVVPGALLTLTMFGMTDTPRWYMKAGPPRRRPHRPGAHPAGGRRRQPPRRHRRRHGRRQRGLLGRGVQPGRAPGAVGRRRAGRVPAGHGHQRHHLLRRQDLRPGRVHHRRRADHRYPVRRRSRERGGHVHRRGLRRPLRPPTAAAHRPGRHGRQPDRGRPVVRLPRRVGHRRRGAEPSGSSPSSPSSSTSPRSPSPSGRSCGR